MNVRQSINLKFNYMSTIDICFTAVVEEQKNIILEAMRHWEEKTCLTFREKSLLDLHFIRFRSDTSGYDCIEIIFYNIILTIV